MQWYVGQPPFQWQGDINRTSRQAAGLTALFHPLMHWRDLMGGYQMTPVGNAAATGVDSQIGRTYSLDGTDDCAYVTLPDSWKLQRFTVSAWMQVTAVPALSTYFSLVPRGAAADGRGLFAYVYTDSKPGIAIGNGTAYSYANSTTAITLGAPVHLAATYDGANVRNYINGQLATTTAIAITISYTDKSTSHGPNPATAYIGAYHNATNTSPSTTADILYDFTGQIGPVSLYNRALSAAEIWSLYDPATRWELYQPPRPTVWWVPPATGTIIPLVRHHMAQQGMA